MTGRGPTQAGCNPPPGLGGEDRRLRRRRVVCTAGSGGLAGVVRPGAGWGGRFGGGCAGRSGGWPASCGRERVGVDVSVEVVASAVAMHATNPPSTPANSPAETVFLA